MRGLACLGRTGARRHAADAARLRARALHAVSRSPVQACIGKRLPARPRRPAHAPSVRSHGINHLAYAARILLSTDGRPVRGRIASPPMTSTPSEAPFGLTERQLQVDEL